MKTALLFVALSALGGAPEQYCGTDVPYDIVIDGAEMTILRAYSSEGCELDQSVATCASGQVMTVDRTNGQALTLNWEGLTMPIIMPKCAED